MAETKIPRYRIRALLAAIRDHYSPRPSNGTNWTDGLDENGNGSEHYPVMARVSLKDGPEGQALPLRVNDRDSEKDSLDQNLD